MVNPVHKIIDIPHIKLNFPVRGVLCTHVKYMNTFLMYVLFVFINTHCCISSLNVTPVNFLLCNSTIVNIL